MHQFGDCVLRRWGPFLAVFAATAHTADIAARTEGIAGAEQKVRKLVLAGHGIGLFVILFAGFGLLAKIGAWVDTWVLGKLVIWFLLGAAPFVIRKARGAAGWIFWLLPVIAGLAAWLALYKPGA